jgi:hypothetical protein
MSEKIVGGRSQNSKKSTIFEVFGIVEFLSQTHVEMIGK